MDSNLSISRTDISVFISVLTASLVAGWVIKKSKEDKNLPPGPWGFPIIGHLPFLGKRPDFTFQKMCKKYGDVFQIYMGSRRTLVVNGAEAARQVLVDQTEDFAGRPNFMSFRYVREGRSFALSTYTKQWKLHKKIVRNALRMFVQHPGIPIENAVQDEADILVNEILSKSGQPQDIKNAIFEAAGSVIFGMCFGAKSDLRNNPYKKKIMGYQKIFQENQKAGGNPADLFPWMESFFAGRLQKFKEAMSGNEAISKELTDSHREDFDPNHLRDISDTFLKALIDFGGDEELKKLGLSELHIMGSVNDLIGPGLNTVWHTMRWAILYMIEYPAIQAKIQDQIDNVIGKDMPKSEDKKHIPLVEATLLEVWRYAAILPFVLPHNTMKDTTLKGFNIPKDTLVFVNMRAVGRDEKVWKDPDTFDPSRFLDEDGNVDKNIAEDALPFGGGARRCPGEQLARIQTFILFTRLLQCCKFEKVPGAKYELEAEFNFAIQPEPHELIASSRWHSE